MSVLSRARAAVRAPARRIRRARRCYRRRTRPRRSGAAARSPSCAPPRLQGGGRRRCAAGRARRALLRQAARARLSRAGGVARRGSATGAGGRRELYLERRAAGAVGSAGVARHRAHARARPATNGGEGAAARRARRAPALLERRRARRCPVRGGVPVRSRRARARRGDDVRAGGNAVIPIFLPLLRGVRRIAGAASSGRRTRRRCWRARRRWRPTARIAPARCSPPPRSRCRSSRIARALHHYRRLLELQPAHERAFVRAVALLEKVGDSRGWSSWWWRARRRPTNRRVRAAMLAAGGAAPRSASATRARAVAALRARSSWCRTISTRT